MPLGRTVKVTISLPEDLLTRIERERHERSASRSALVRVALEEMLHERQRRVDVEQYIRGYEEHPETAEEVVAAERMSQSVWGEAPWE